MNRLPVFAVTRSTVVIAFVLMFVCWGIFSAFTMPRREDPEFTLKIAVVGTRWPGASAEKVEELVTDPLEEAIATQLREKPKEFEKTAKKYTKEHAK